MDKEAFLSNYKVKKEFIIYFLIGCVGMITHIYMFTNKFYNEDDVNNLIKQASQTDLGRWLADIKNMLFFQYSVPMINGITAIVLLTIASVIICKFYDIQNALNVFLCGCIVVTFPVVACNFTYMSGANIYASALLLAVLFNYFIYKSTLKGHYMYAIIFMVFSLSLYQVYICLAIGMFWIKLIIESFEQENRLSFRIVITRMLKYFSCLVIALIVYYMTVKISLIFTSKSLATYQNLDKIFEIHIMDYFLGFLKTYYRAIMFFCGCFYGKISIFLLVTNAVLLLVTSYFIIRLYKFEGVIRNLLIILEIFLLPALIESAEILAATAESRHMLMRHASMLWYFIPIIVFENYSKRCSSQNRKMSRICYGCIAIIIFINFCYCNLAYYKCNLTTSNLESLLTRVATSIEMTDGYVPNKTKVWIDSEKGIPLYKNNKDDFPEIANMMGVNDEYRLFYLNRLESILHNYLYLQFENPTQDEIDAITKSKEYLEMECYPYKNSIVWIDDVLVVKMASEDE